jgi:hypothetical protein
MTSVISDWISFLAYPNLFGIKGFVVVVVLDLLKTGKNIKQKRKYFSEN